MPIYNEWFLFEKKSAKHPFKNIELKFCKDFIEQLWFPNEKIPSDENLNWKNLRTMTWWQNNKVWDQKKGITHGIVRNSEFKNIVEF